jgi:pimeloyl-ACP methyl ester carboxylesterase
MHEFGVAMQTVQGHDLIEAFGGLIGDADKKVLTQEYADNFAAMYRRSVQHNFDGWIDDDLAFIQKFGFELSAINKPVEIWQGNDDFMVPHAHSKWLHEKITTSTLKFIRGEGHISLMTNYRQDILDAAISYFRN